MTGPGQRLPRSSDYFARVPYRVRDALVAGELSFKEFALLMFLILDEDYRSQEVLTTLGVLAARMQWPSDDRQHTSLLRAVKALRPTWIEFTVTKGQRSPYCIRLTGAAVKTEGSVDVGASHDPRAEVTSAVQESDSGPSAQPTADSGPLEPRLDRGPEKRREEHVPEEEPSGSSSGTPVPQEMTDVSIELRALMEKARIACEQGRR
jgi:hypothetical protein